MIAAIYARKSTAQAGDTEDRSVARQVAKARPSPRPKAGRSPTCTSTSMIASAVRRQRGLWPSSGLLALIRSGEAAGPRPALGAAKLGAYCFTIERALGDHRDDPDKEE